MTVDADALAKELKFLRRGRAMRHAAVLKRLGPQLRSLVGLGPDDNAAVLRARMTSLVDELLVREPRDVRLAVLAALALHPEADQRDLALREAWLAQQLNCHERTARRRVTEAFDLFVAAAAERDDDDEDFTEPGADDSWYVQSVRAFMRLDGPSPELTEQRCILFTRDEVTEFVCLFSLPRPRPAGTHDVIAELLYGGHVRETERPSDEHFRFLVDLPRAYRRGETHDYGIRFRLPPGQPMKPHYVMQPLFPCRAFDLTIRFDPDRPPGLIWLLNGVPPRVLDAAQPGTDVVDPDKFGELHLAFRHLRQGFAYGVKWS